MLIKRKQLPSFIRLEKKFDISDLVEKCQKYGLLDFSKYNDIRLDSNSDFVDLVKANSLLVSAHFKDHDEEDMNSDKYRHLYLTGLHQSIQATEKDSQTKRSDRLKRISPGSSVYTPQVDELNYGKRIPVDHGIFDEVLNFFDGKVCRVRLAVMRPKFKIIPHIDYDPSYISRFHLPLITNKLCSMHVIRNTAGLKVEEKTYFEPSGHLYFLNTGFKHWAENNSDQDRLHLIIDVHGQKELESSVLQ
ncbi:aspartyl/asparaginyl beta-hydroxylase domain-containing protein [Arenimonas sp.]|nr:aspartyl/asparaginyl beta-hydroxylase domain-containing protein [Candidatus Parcubacteria bacterium]